MKQNEVNDMGKVLAPDEIKPGMRITVVNNKPYEPPSLGRVLLGDEWKGIGVAHHTETIDRSYMGDVLTVLSLDYPFIAARKESEYAHSRYNISLDIRRSALMSLSDEYVRSICPYLFKENNS